MKSSYRNLRFIALAIALALCDRAGAQYLIASSVIANGGQQGSGGGYIITGTAGQGGIGAMSNGVNIGSGGFWYTTSLLPAGRTITEIEPNNDSSKAMPILLGDTVLAAIDPTGDIDYYSFTAFAGDTVEFFATPRGNSTLYSYFEVYDSAGVYWLQGYFPRQDRKIHEIFVVPNTSKYYVRYRYSSNYTGNFPNSVGPPGGTPVAPIQNVPSSAAMSPDTGAYKLVFRRFSPSAPDVDYYNYSYNVFYNSVTGQVGFQPNALPTTVTFQYGTTTSYGSSVVAPGGPFSGTNRQYITAQLTGLSGGTTYYLRTVVSNSAGSDTSDPSQFTTPAAPDGWTIPATGVGNTLYAVSFPVRDTGYVVGWGSPFLKTTNGGTSWTTTTLGYYLHGLSFFNVNNGVAVGYSGTILRTTNGGTGWASQNVSSSMLNSVQYLNASTLVAVGDTILRSIDGGVSWTGIARPVGSTLYSLHFVNSTTGTAVGDNDVILRTTNGGQTWASQASGSSGNLYSVYMMSSNTVIAVGSNRRILRTTDGGSSWTNMNPVIGSYLRSVWFVNSSLGYTAGDYGRIFRTVDGGITWNEVASGTANNLYSLWARGFNNAGAVGDYGTIVSAIDVAPAAPQNLAAAGTGTGVSLKWNKNTEYDFMKYMIYRGTSANPTSKFDSTSGGITDTSKIIAGSLGIRYYFRITAMDSSRQESNYSNEVNALVNQPPAAPLGFTATSGINQIILKWRKNAETNFKRYRIYRSQSPNPTTLSDSTATINDTTKNVTVGLTPGVLYYFRVTAVDTLFIESAYSNQGFAVSSRGQIAEVEPNNDSSKAQTVFMSDSILANINPSGDIDYYKFYAAAGDTVEFFAKPRVNSTLTSVFQVLDSLGQTWHWGDFPRLDRRIHTVFPVSNSRTYFVRYRYSSNYSTNFPNSVGGSSQPPFMNQVASVASTILSSDTGAYGLLIRRFVPSSPDIQAYTSRYNIFYNSATLQTNVRPNGLPTTLTVQYGITQTYGSSYVFQAGPFTGLNQYLVDTLKNLSSNTTYYARIIASNSAGADTSDEYTFQTPQSPTSWVARASGSSNDFYSIWYSSPTVGYATGWGSAKTTDGGTTWSSMSINNGNYGLTFPSANTGFAVGYSGTIQKTTDAGNTWNSLTSGTSVYLRGVTFRDTSNGLATGDNGTILRTTNGGTTWTSQTSGVTDYLWGVKFLSSTVAIAVGASGKIVRSSDGGVTWSVQTSNTTQPLFNMAVVDQNTAFTVGYGTILKTTDAGVTWVATQLSPSNYLYGISFANSQIGVAVGSSGIIWRTTNGGSTWQREESGTTNELLGAWVTGYNSGTVGGQYGTILSTIDGPPVSPQNVAAIGGPGSITVRWNRNTEFDFMRYRIYRSLSPNPTTLFDSTSGGLGDTSRTYSGLDPTTRYYFRVTAVDNVFKESAYSTEVNALPNAAPAAPQNLTATAGINEITIKWRRNSEADFLRYRIYRNTSPGASSQIDSATTISDTARTYTGLTAGLSYYFRVKAIDSLFIESAYSNEVSAAASRGLIAEVEPNDDSTTAQRMFYSDTISAAIRPSGDKDYYKFYAANGDTLEFYFNVPLGSDLYGYARVYDSLGNNFVNHNFYPWTNGNNRVWRVNNSRTYFMRLTYQSTSGTFPNSVNPRNGPASPMPIPMPQQSVSSASVDTGAYGIFLRRFVPSRPRVDYISGENIFSTTMQSTVYLRPNGAPTTLTLQYGLTTSYGGSVTASGTFNDIGTVYPRIMVTGLQPGAEYHFRTISTNNAGVDTSSDYVYRTADAPFGWASQSSGVTNELFDIQFLNQSIGLAGGYAGLLRTTNGGSSWNQVSTPSGSYFFGISFPDASHGWVASNSGIILRSNDAGATWLSQTSNTPYWLRSVSFVDTSKGIAGGENGTIVRTTNGGATWSSQQLSGFTNTVWGVKFFNSTTALAVGYGAIFKTTDAGATWTRLTNGVSSSVSYTSAWFFDANNAIVVGDYIMRTTDGGASWSSQNTPTNNTMYDVTFFNSTDGVMVGYDGAIFRTADGGQTWISEASGTRNLLFGVFSSSYLSTYAVGNYGVILRASDAPPKAPLNLAASGADQAVRLKWNKNTEGDFMRYRIYGGTSPNPTTKLDSTVAGLSDTSKIITALTNDVTYYFRVTGVDSAFNESAYSNEVSAKPIPAPVITSLSPTKGGVGSLVTISGEGFSGVATDNYVYFGSVRGQVTTASPTSLTVRVPGGASHGPVSVTSNGRTGYTPQYFTVTFSATRTVNSQTFAGKVDFTAGTGPTGVAVGDLDGDGKVDVVTTNIAGGSVSVFRNVSTGNITAGTFENKIDFTTGISPRAVALADVDGDGKLDIVVANSASGSVSVLRNTSSSGSITSSSFATKVDFTTGTSPVGVAVRDLDADGRPEIVTSNSSGPSVSVLRNISISGTISVGSFSTRVDFPSGTNPQAVAIGDIDGDGKADIVTANNTGNSVSVFRNTVTTGITSGSFAAKVDVATSNSPVSVAIADIDGDGKLDVNTASVGDVVSVLRNTSTTGSVSLAAKVDFSTGNGATPQALTIGDVDGDGKVDIAVSNNGGNTVSVFRNNSSAGSITSASFVAKVDFAAAVNGGPFGLALNDIDGDGKPEITVANQNTGSVSVMKNLAPLFETEPNDSASVAMLIAYGDTLDGAINPRTDKDYYKFVAAQNDTIDLNIYPVGNSTLEGRIILMDSAGAAYDYIDQTQTGQWRHLFRVPFSGTWYLRLSSYAVGFSGFPNAIGSSANNPEETRIMGVRAQVSQSSSSSAAADTGQYRLRFRRFIPSSPDVRYQFIRRAYSNSVQLTAGILANGAPTNVAFQFGTTTNYGTTIAANRLAFTNLYADEVFAAATNLTPGTSYHFRVSTTNAFGTVVSKNYSFTTPDSSQGWIRQTVGLDRQLNDVSFVDVNNGYAAGNGVFKTTSGGVSWSDVSNNIGIYIYGLQFLNSSTGIAVGQNIWGTADGGVSWTQRFQSNYYNFAVRMVNSITGYAVGQNGVIRKTTDGGSQWSEQTSPVTRELYAVHFVDVNNGYAVGQQGTVVKTTNGGSTWTDISSTNLGWLYSVAFVHRDTGFVAGNNGVVFRTVNGGGTWTNVFSAGNTLRDIMFMNSQNGIAVGGGGTIIRTTNGGTTWTRQESGTSNFLQAVSFPSVSVGTVVGNDETVLHFDATGTAPIAATRQTVNITTTTAVVRAAVNPSTLSTTAYFQYDTSLAFNFTTSSRSIGNGIDLVDFQDTLKNLIPNQRYYARVVGQNSKGATTGNTDLFFTRPLLAPKTPVALQVSAQSSVQINIAWVDSSDNETGFKIERKTAISAYSQIDSLGPDNASYSNIGLTAGTKYFYRVRAYNNVGGSAFTNEDTATTQNVPANTPVAPSALGLTSVSTSQINLSWQDNSTNEISYRIDRKTGAAGTYAQIDTVLANVKTYQSTGLNPSTTYYFQVRAYNGSSVSGGLSPYSSAANIATQALQPKANIAITFTKLNFGNRELGSGVKDTTIVVTNDGGASMIFNSASVSGTNSNQFSILSGGSPALLLPGQSRQVRIRFNPTSLGTKTALVTFDTDDPNQGNPPGVIVDTLQGAAIDTTAPSAPIGGSISPTGWTNANSFTISWTGPSDPSGIAKLWYKAGSAPTASSSGTSVNQVGNSAPVSLPSVGRQTVYFFLEDSAGKKTFSNYATAVAQFDSVKPTITHTAANVGSVTITSGAVSANNANVTANATKSSGAGIVASTYQLQYKRSVDVNWTSQIFNVPTILIPSATFVTNSKPNAVDYRITATDSAGNVRTTQAYSVRVITASSILSDYVPPPVTTLPTGTAIERAYRLFSVPLDLTDKKPSSIFGTSLGAHESEGVAYYNWRLERFSGGTLQQYESFKDQSVVTPGAGFWLILRDPGKTITVGAGSLVKGDSMRSAGLSLSQGWNILGNPFAFSVLKDSLLFAAGDTVKSVAYFSGSGLTSGWDLNNANSDTLRAWQGLAINMNKNTTVKFRVAAVEPGSDVDVLKIEKPNIVAMGVAGEQKNWLMQVDASRRDNDMQSLENYVGMVSGSKSGYDLFDWMTPPMIGRKNVSISFRNGDEGMMRDIRPVNDQGEAWDMRVVTGDRAAKLRLDLSGAKNLPNPDFEAYLVDLDEKMAYDLKIISSVEFNSKEGLRNFKLIVGTRQFAIDNSGGVDLIPQEMRLYSNYPNPFNPETVVRYQISGIEQKYNVSLKIYNLIGQEVASLVDKEQQPGYYEVRFNGRSLSTGVYFYRLIIDGNTNASRFTDVKKMMLLK